MIRRLDHVNVKAINACASYPTCDSYGSFDHVTLNCHAGNPFIQSSSEQVAYVSYF